MQTTTARSVPNLQMLIAFGVILAVFMGVLLLPSMYRVFIGVPLRALRTKLAARAAAAAASGPAQKATADKDSPAEAETTAAAGETTTIMEPRASTRALPAALSLRGSEGVRSRGAASSSSSSGIREITPAAAALPRGASSGAGFGSAAAGVFSSKSAHEGLDSDAAKDTQKRSSKPPTAAAAATAAAATAGAVPGCVAARAGDAAAPAAAAAAGATHKESGLAFPTPAWLERGGLPRLLQPAFRVRKHVLYAVSTVYYPEGQSRVLQVRLWVRVSQCAQAHAPRTLHAVCTVFYPEGQSRVLQVGVSYRHTAAESCGDQDRLYAILWWIEQHTLCTWVRVSRCLVYAVSMLCALHRGPVTG